MPKPHSTLVAGLILAVLALSACTQAGRNPSGPQEGEFSWPEEISETGLPEVDPFALSGDVIIAGSSTVYPLAETMAVRMQDEGFSGSISIASIGSGAGFERFCVAGETDIVTASRDIDPDEIKDCQAIGRTPVEFRVGTDALVIAVSRENNFLQGLSMEQLAAVYSTAKTWADIDPAFPAQAIRRFSPGTDSGTYDYFLEVVMNDDAAALLNASNLQSSEDDNVLVQGVTGSPYAVGYFGYAFYLENQANLKVLAIDGVEPNLQTTESGEYPLARPLLLYSDAMIMRNKPQVAGYLNFFLSFVNEEIENVGYFPASPEALQESREKWLQAVGWRQNQ